VAEDPGIVSGEGRLLHTESASWAEKHTSAVEDTRTAGSDIRIGRQATEKS